MQVSRFLRFRRAIFTTLAVAWVAAAALAVRTLWQNDELHQCADIDLRWLGSADQLQQELDGWVAELHRMGEAGARDVPPLPDAWRDPARADGLLSWAPPAVANATDAAQDWRTAARLFRERAAALHASAPEAPLDLAPPDLAPRLELLAIKDRLVNTIGLVKVGVHRDLAQVKATLDRGRIALWLLAAVALLSVGVQGLLLKESIREQELFAVSRVALASSEKRYRELFEESRAIKVVIDPRSQLIIDANEAAALWYGFTRDELVGKHVSAVNPLPREEVDRLFAQILSGEVREFALPQRMKSGEIRETWASITPVHTEDGPVLYSILFDITEQKHAELELRESEQRFRLMADEAPVLIAIADAQARTVFVNRNWLALTGRTFGTELGHGWPELVEPEDRARVVAESVAAAREQRSYELEYRVQRTDGEWRWVLDRGVPRRDDDGAFLGHACVAIDITDRKLFEERQRESQRMEAMGRLAGGIAHDLNNILTVVLGSAELLIKQRGDDPVVHENAEEIRAASERAATLVSQLLAFTRRQVVAPVDLDLHDSVLAMGGLLRRLIGEDVELVIAPQPGMGAVRMDPAQFTQVVLNLAINARQAMPDGGELSITTHLATLDGAAAPRTKLPHDGDWIALEVRDSGTGMDRTTRARIFEPFYTTKKQGLHAGLGLATVKTIVDQCGGVIEVESAPETGTCFRVWLPRSTTNGGATAVIPAARELPARRGLATILLVEDDAAVRPLICRYLQSGGYQVVEAEDGAEALVQARAHAPIDVLLTDVVMPRMGGRKLAERLVKEQPEAQVLYMSGYTDDEVLRHGVSHEEQPFLHKPFSREELLRKIAEVLTVRRPAPSSSKSRTPSGEAREQVKEEE